MKPTTFAAVVEQLELSEDYQNIEHVRKLAHFCHSRVSQDRQFDLAANPSAAYSAYYALAKEYYDNFLSHWTAPPKTTAILEAAQQGYHYFLEQLDPAFAAELNSLRGEYGMTALHYAARNGYPKTLTTLVNKGANSGIENERGQYPIQAALFFPTLSTEQRKAAALSCYEILEQAASPEILKHVDESGDTLLHSLSVLGFSQALKQLGQKVPSLIKTANNWGKFPIHLAILNPQSEEQNTAEFASVKVLLEFDGCAALMDRKRQLPLHYAASYANPEIIRLCLAKNSPIDALDREGNSALLLAAKAGKLDNLVCLIDQGADQSIANAEGNILHHAVRQGQENIVHWLVEQGQAETLNLAVNGLFPIDLATEQPDLLTYLECHCPKNSMSRKC